jgi:glycosyltransferase involved in cell wall biosynthesis
MLRTPYISVIIPVYNLENYLHESIGSVLGQTYQDLEIILIDDGSTDNSRSILRDYARQYPHKIRYHVQENQGAAAARNTGIAMAQGEWIAFLDGDDLWASHKLERQIQVVQGNPSINFLSSQAQLYGGSKLLHEFIPSPNGNIKYELLLFGNFMTVSTVMLKKELLLVEKFDHDLIASHDYDLFLRLADKIHDAFLAEPLAFYRVRHNSLSTISDSRWIQFHKHYQMVKKELVMMQANAEALPPCVLIKIKRRMQQFAHEAAYAAIWSSNASLCTKLTPLHAGH